MNTFEKLLSAKTEQLFNPIWSANTTWYDTTFNAGVNLHDLERSRGWISLQPINHAKLCRP